MPKRGVRLVTPEGLGTNAHATRPSAKAIGIRAVLISHKSERPGINWHRFKAFQSHEPDSCVANLQHEGFPQFKSEEPRSPLISEGSSPGYFTPEKPCAIPRGQLALLL